MDLFERYLHAVRSFLPKAQQEDVVRELSEELRSQADEQEAALGRPLNAAEQAQILRHFGHPLLLASRYRPQRYIVGPAVFPIYSLVLKVALGVTLLVHVISAAVFLANGRPVGDVDEIIFRFEPFLMAFAWVTLVFAALDRTVLRFPVFTDWDPRSLPEAKTASPPALWCRITEVVMTAVFLLWLAAAPYNQWLIFGPAWTLIQLGQPWFSIHLAMLVLVGANLVAMVIALRYSERQTLRSVTRVATDVGSLVLIIYLLKAGDLIVAAAPAGGGADSLAALMNRIGRVALGITVLVVLIETVRETLRLIDARRVTGSWSPRRG